MIEIEAMESSTYTVTDRNFDENTIEELATKVQRAFVGLGWGWKVFENPLTEAAHKDIADTIVYLLNSLRESAEATSTGTAGVMVIKNRDDDEVFSYDVGIDLGWVQ